MFNYGLWLSGVVLPNGDSFYFGHLAAAPNCHKCNRARMLIDNLMPINNAISVGEKTKKRLVVRESVQS
jgi:hypothetical protein